MSRSINRTITRQMDVVEWSRLNKQALKTMAAVRYAESKGVLDYLKDAGSFVVEWRSNSKKAKAEKEAKAKADALAKTEGKTDEAGAATPAVEEKKADPVQQYYYSQDLLKRVKWKRVTWDAEADYEAFSRRVFDNFDSMFNKVPAFSFMSLHVIHDPRNPSLPMPPPATMDFKQGAITSWLLEERTPNPPKPYILEYNPANAKKESRAAHTVDWVAGEARISDTISANELLAFLHNVAPRLQAVQQRMEEEQAKITEDIDYARIRLGVSAIKYNKYDRSLWDDPARRENPDEYVTPAEVRQFIDSVFKRAFLLRLHLKGQQIRLVRPGQPFKIDQVEKEVHVPTNFADYNFLTLHSKFESMERVFNFCRSLWWFWFSLGVLIVGDFEWI